MRLILGLKSSNRYILLTVGYFGKWYETILSCKVYLRSSRSLAGSGFGAVECHIYAFSQGLAFQYHASATDDIMIVTVMA